MKEARSQNSVYSVLPLKEERPTYTYEYVFTSIQMDSLEEYIYYKLRQLPLGGGLEGERLNSAPLFNTWIFFTVLYMNTFQCMYYIQKSMNG